MKVLQLGFRSIIGQTHDKENPVVTQDPSPNDMSGAGGPHSTSSLQP